MTKIVTGPPRCTCPEDGNARRCPFHTQADFDAADRVRGLGGVGGPVSREAVLAELAAVVDEINACQREIVERTEDWAAQQWEALLDQARHEWVEQPAQSGRAIPIKTALPDEEAARRVAELEADEEQKKLVTPRPYNDDKMRKLVEAKASALHAMALLVDSPQAGFDHGIVYETGLEAVCKCGSTLSIYGRTNSMAGALAEHIRNARQGGRR